ncbi:MAG: DUF2085 domain-containing protein [Anaerolineae bacterium]|nr:DUF2085 domain-containing protein [Anaerolineae bacterium]
MTGVLKTQERAQWVRWTRWVAIGLAVLALGAYFLLTPPGLLTKTDWIGAAVCHRIPSHSFHIGGRQLPLCARCTGTFPGALIGLLGQAALRRRRESGFPPAPILALLVGFIVGMGIDGLNSYWNLMTGSPLLYEPRQELRLITGTLNGLSMSALLWPLVNFSLWRDPSPKPAIRNGLDLLILLLMEASWVILVLAGLSPLLPILALFSAAGVLTTLTLIFAVLVTIFFGRENRYSRWRDALTPLLVGFFLALTMIGLMDLFRYGVFGTITGFPGME